MVDKYIGCATDSARINFSGHLRYPPTSSDEEQISNNTILEWQKFRNKNLKNLFILYQKE